MFLPRLGGGALLVLCLLRAAGAAETAPKLDDILELSIEELRTVKVATVTGASRFEQKVTEAPSSVTVITAAEIRNFGHRTLMDILRSVRSLYFTYDRNYSYAGIRGFSRPGDYNTRLLLLIDGHRVNDNIYDQAPTGTEFVLDVDLIERVEVIRGPGSSLYGSNAFFGVINVITRRGNDVRGLEAAGSASLNDTYAGRLTYGKEGRGGPDMLLSGSWYSSGGARHLYYPEYDAPATNNGVADHRDGDQYRNAFARTSWKEFTLEGAYGYREKFVPTGSYGTIFNDPANRTVDERAYVDLSWRRSWGAGTQATARLFYDAYAFTGDYMIDYPPPTPNRDTAEGRWWGAEAQVTTTLAGRHKITAGADYRDNFRQDQANFDLTPYASYLDSKRTSQVWALYVQDEFRVMDSLLLNVGIRHDDYSSFGGETNPRAALIYTPTRESTVKLIYGTAFRAPNVYEMFYADGVASKANPDLQPETIDTYELIYERYFGRQLRTSVSAFRYCIFDLISQITDPADNLLQFRNVDHVEAKGGEFEVEKAWQNGARGRASYTLQKAKDRTTGMVLTNSPEHLAKLGAVLPLRAQRFFVSPEAQYTGTRKTVGGGHAGAYTVVNVTVLGREVVRGLDASFTVYNLFDRAYADPGAGPPQHIQDTIAQDGRNVRLQLTYRFN